MAALAQMGWAAVVELLAATQAPQRINASITGQRTEPVCFRLDDDLALVEVEEPGMDRAAVQGLVPGNFLALNRVTRARLARRVF